MTDTQRLERLVTQAGVPSECYRCGASTFKIQHRGLELRREGRYHVGIYNADGTNHFDSCGKEKTE